MQQLPNAIFHQLLNHQDYHLKLVINVEPKIKKQEVVSMKKENRNVSCAEVLLIASRINKYHYAVNVKILHFVFIINLNHHVVIVMGLHFVFMLNKNQDAEIVKEFLFVVTTK